MAKKHKKAQTTLEGAGTAAAGLADVGKAGVDVVAEQNAEFAAAVPVEATAEPEVAAKVTKRSQVLTNAKIELGDKPNKMRAGHNTKVWDAVCAILPATAAEIMKLQELNEPPIVAGVMLSYMLRRGYLKIAE